MRKLILVDEPEYLLDETGLTFKDEQLPLERWEALGKVLAGFEKASAWGLGDWLLGGERLYGERYSQGLSHLRLDPKTARHYRWVAREFEPSRRRTTLSWSHHYEVASLAPHQQEDWLDEAERNGWSSHELRKHVRDASGRGDTQTDPLDKAKGAWLALDEDQRGEFDVWLETQRIESGV